ncbi:MAG TPA: hypothetical protein VEA59_02920 [Patescibacteria group bacterium]|nr:hypothetical protein [Patescibacteria group bacterium]
MRKFIYTVLSLCVLWIVSFFIIVPKQHTPMLGEDKKSIVEAGTVLFSVDREEIFTWFRTSSQLCDEANISTAPDRQSFCTNKDTFKAQTRFANVVVSPDNQHIGFTIESDTLTPDKVVGVFSRKQNLVTLLTNYYLGNEFISFSPTGTHFIYQGACFEGLCGFLVKETQSLTTKTTINIPEFLDGARAQNVTFVRWVSDNQLEYKEGEEVKQISF